jgi:uncharacterized membrane protein YeaQ/YmgE (transglycosylase-associated protein family)
MALLASSVCAVPAVAWAQTADPTTNEGVGIIAWIVIGLIAGYLASHIVNKSGEGMVLDIILGIVGALSVANLSLGWQFRRHRIQRLECICGLHRRRGAARPLPCDTRPEQDRIECPLLPYE